MDKPEVPERVVRANPPAAATPLGERARLVRDLATLVCRHVARAGSRPIKTGKSKGRGAATGSVVGNADRDS